MRGNSRNFKGGGRRSFGTKEMYSARCSNCGKDCKVPFRPTGSKPVYCSDCFEKMGNKSNSRSFESRNDRRGSFRQRSSGHEAVCDDCGRRCSVPFRPEPGKATYCDRCFQRHTSKVSQGTVKDLDFTAQFAELNDKLDQILDFLHAAIVEVDDEYADGEGYEDLALEETDADEQPVEIIVSKKTKKTKAKKEPAKKTKKATKSKAASE